MKEIKKILVNRSKEVNAAQKRVSGYETELEQKRADRHSTLKMCKVQIMCMQCVVKHVTECIIQFADIKLPFHQGSMDDIEDEVHYIYCDGFLLLASW